MRQELRMHSRYEICKSTIDDIIENDTIDLQINGALDVSVQTISVCRSKDNTEFEIIIIYNIRTL